MKLSYSIQKSYFGTILDVSGVCNYVDILNSGPSVQLHCSLQGFHLSTPLIGESASHHPWMAGSHPWVDTSCNFAAAGAQENTFHYHLHGAKHSPPSSVSGRPYGLKLQVLQNL